MFTENKIGSGWKVEAQAAQIAKQSYRCAAIFLTSRSPCPIHTEHVVSAASSAHAAVVDAPVRSPAGTSGSKSYAVFR